MCPLPQKSEQRLNGIAISRGGCDFPAVRLRPVGPRAARCIVMSACDDRAADICRHPAEINRTTNAFCSRAGLYATICSAKRCSRWRVECGETAWANGLGSRSLVSSCLGGTAAAITRYLAGNTDPITLAILRWGIGFCCVLPAALLLKARWPRRSDWPAVAALGFCFFGVFFVLYNIAMSYTTAARARSRWRHCRCAPWWSAPYSASSR